MDIFHGTQPLNPPPTSSFLFNAVPPFPNRILSLAGVSHLPPEQQQHQLPLNVLPARPPPLLDLSHVSPNTPPRLTFSTKEEDEDEEQQQRRPSSVKNGNSQTRPQKQQRPKKTKRPHVSGFSIEKLRAGEGDGSAEQDPVLLSQEVGGGGGNSGEEDGKFVSRTKIINNAPFPQIVIIPQKQGGGEGQGDEYHINIHNPANNDDDNNNDSLDLPGLGKAPREGHEDGNGRVPRKQQLVAQRQQLTVQQEQLAAQLLGQQQQHQEREETSPARLEQLEQLIRRQEGLLARLEAERAADRPDNALTEQRITELEAASARQAEILASLGEAVEDVNVESANTATRLTVLETIASRQKKGGRTF